MAIYESMYSIKTTKDLNINLEKVHNIIIASSDLRKNPFFNKLVLNQDIEEIRFNALRDYTIYQQAIRDNRKRLKKEEKEKLLLKYEKQTIPYQNYVAIDIETTGLKKDYHEIIEIAAVKVVNGFAIEYFKSLIKPKRKLPKKIIEITEITDNDLVGERTIDEILPEFYEYIKDYPLIAHNAAFDMGFLKFQAEKLDLKINNKIVDTLSLSRKYLREIKQEGLSYKLGDICSYIGYRPAGSHRAYDDALAAGFIYHYICQNTNYPEKPIYYDLYDADIYNDVL